MRFQIGESKCQDILLEKTLLKRLLSTQSGAEVGSMLDQISGSLPGLNLIMGLMAVEILLKEAESPNQSSNSQSSLN